MLRLYNAGNVRPEEHMEALRNRTRMDLSDVGALLLMVVRGLVNVEEEVSILELTGERCTLLEVTVHPEDMGRLLGQRGCNVEALRVLLTGIGGNEGREYVLRVVDPTRRR